MPLYATPRFVNNLADCFFYHTMSLPELGSVKGNWDLTPNIENYLGHVDFSNKRVLDIGCASGALSFHMERQGASVVSFDLDRNGDWDMVPYSKWDLSGQIAQDRKRIIDQLNNSYWLAHRLLGSKAQVVYGSVYSIPDAIGRVDISVFGSILLHLRDPFFALQNGLKLTGETVIVSDVLRFSPVPFNNLIHGSCLGFLPDAETLEPKDTWWDIRPEWVRRAIAVLGFEDSEIHYHVQKYDGRDEQCYTVVGKRTHMVSM